MLDKDIEVNVVLRKNNKPKKSGWYLAQKSRWEVPVLLDIRGTGKNLEIVGAWGIYPLKKENKTTLWSDAITITKE
jgi:hypothetical protein